MKLAFKLAGKRFLKGFLATLVTVLISYLIQFVSTDPLFQQPDIAAYAGLAVSVLLAIQKFWETNKEGIIDIE